MKQLKNFLLTLLLFSLSGFLASAQAAGSISGTVSYSGSPPGPIYVVAFMSPLSCVPPNPNEFAIIEIPSLGSYTISDLPDGTYYIASAILACGMDCPLQPTDPWGVHGGCGTSAPVVISGGNAVSNIDITLVDGMVGSPNPFYDPYNTSARSRHENGGYYVNLDVDDESHSLTSVNVTGPGLAGRGSLVFNQNRWELATQISFGSIHPAPPLAYDFEIIDDGETYFRTEVVESFVDVFATNLSPAGGESVTGTPELSWTGVGDGYTYGVGVNGNGIYWNLHGLTSTSVVYGGPQLTPGQPYYWYVDVHDAYDNLSQAGSSFVYVQPTTLSVIKDGSGGGTVTSSPAGIDCGSDCENGYPLGGQVRLTAAPDSGSVFAGWSGGGCYGIGDCFSDLSSNTNVTATFSLAGSISGTVSYSGSQTDPTDPIYVVAFTSPLSCTPPTPEEYAITQIPTLGIYTLPDLPDGTYYVASAILSCGTDCALQPTDPWGVHGGCDAATPIVISGGSDVSGKDITLVDGTVGSPNPFYDSYRAGATSRHENDAYWVWLSLDDQAHHATSVSVTGPGISESIDLAFDTDEWKSAESISFGASHPEPPLTYTFTITDPEGTHIRTKIVESFVDVFATNLSPSGGEFVIGTPVFSWTDVGNGYEYYVGVYGNGFNWNSDRTAETSVIYNGSQLTVGQTYYWYVEIRDVYDNISKAQQESFVYTQGMTLTVVRNGTGSGSVTSSPAGIDCRDDCTNEYPAGSQVMLSAVPDSGSAFAGWSGGGCNGIGDCIPALISDTTVTATFAQPGSNPITLSVAPSVLPADSTTGFSFQTQASATNGTIMFELIHDADGNGVVDGNEWPIWSRMFADNQWVDYDGFLSGDANSSSAQITIDFDFNGGLFPAGDYIARVTNTIGESATIPLSIIAVSTSQSVTGIVYEQGTMTPVPNAIVYAVNPITENFVSAAVSAGDGAFNMLIPAPGDIAVGSDKDGYISNDMSLVNVLANGTANQNIFLILPDAQITGTVTEYYTGNPVWGADVGAKVDGTDNQSNTVTNIDGSFSLPALNGVDWRLNLDEPPGYFGGLAVTHNFESNPVIVPTVSGPNRVDFTVHKINAWIDGTILDEYGMAIEGADFHVYRINTSDIALQRLYDDGSSDASGQVSAGVESGDWGMWLSVSSVLVNGTPKEMVSPGQADVLGLLTGEHRPATMQAYYADGAVEGTVFEADGVTPAADVNVNAHTDDALNGPAQISVGQIDTGTRADANGHYRLPLLGGTWTISAWISGGTVKVSRVITLTTDGNDAIDQPGETLTGINLMLPVLTIIKDGDGTGTITSSPLGIDCGNDCVAVFSKGTLVTLTAIGDQYSAFDSWSGGGCSGNGTCLTTMDEDKSVTATFTFDNTPPALPTGLSGSQVGVQVNLFWTANSEPDILGYNVYRDGVKINTDPITSNNYSDPIAGGKTYVYNVTAVDRALNQSPFSVSVSVPTEISAPVINDPLPGTSLIDSEITVRGTADPGSTVEIFVNGVSQGTTLASSTGAFSLTGVMVNEGENSITAVSTNTYGEISPVSEQVTVPVNPKPSAPQGLAASPGDTTVTITWNSVSEPDVQGYNIYRDGAQVNNNLLTETTYTDVRLTNGRAYNFTVTAVDTNAGESDKSNTITVTPVAGPGWE